jgi:hypothetical protein
VEGLEAEGEAMKQRTFLIAWSTIFVSGVVLLTLAAYAHSAVLRSDPSTDPDPVPLWGQLQAVSSSRYQQFDTGGPTNFPAYRKLTVQDGDDFFGERTELGANESRFGLGGPDGTFFLYQPGTTATTRWFMRLPSSFPINTSNWQVVQQMKQTQPYVASDPPSSPILSVEARDGRWNLMTNGNVLWAGPTAKLGKWVKFIEVVTYSASAGHVQITIGGTASPTFDVPTLATATQAGDGYAVGDPIPSHLRLGIYHNPVIAGTSVDIAGVQVTG